MRTRKFRARWKENKQIIPDFMQNHKIEDLNSPVLIIEEFTGLVDCHGVDIYENDIIESTYNGESCRHLIGYDEQQACFTTSNIPLMRFVSSSGIRQSWITEFDKKVIGNQYDNPILLN